ncbi:MAG: hypothetical protein WC030_02110 [Candidatus Paceibacterota bacterium]
MHKFDDIIPPSRRREAAPTSQPDTKLPRTPRPRGRFPYLTVFMVLVVIAGSAGALMYFSSAKIEVVPSTIAATVQGSFTAGQATTDLPFKVITAQKVASQNVQSNGTKTVNSAASGTITIYNTQAKAQTLITNTRFATASGLIFRIRAAVTVPGGSADKPGSVSAKVYADKEGSTYNVGPTSFTIPGFAGTPQATQVYARSTEAMSGGASGTVPVVDAAGALQARTALTAALGPDLEKSLKEQVPPEYVLLTGASATTFQDLDPAPTTTAGQVEVRVQGTATAVIFQNAGLAKAIALASAGGNYQGEPLTIASSEGLTLVPTAGIPDAAATSFAFSLSGTAPLVYFVDQARIAAAVAGKDRQAAQVALTNYPEVNRAIIVLRPFWKQSFPEDPASISIVVTNP